MVRAYSPQVGSAQVEKIKINDVRRRKFNQKIKN